MLTVTVYGNDASDDGLGDGDDNGDFDDDDDEP